jgi:hypothetical protein
MAISNDKLDFWIKHELNVLLEGKHGVGKTGLSIAAFKRNNKRYAYFSGATMDPWVDFVGIPTKVRVAVGGPNEQEVIRFIRPEHLVDLNVDIILMDELNRSAKKVRNAVMELIQFKTINGVPFSPNLKAVWGCINPDNAEGDNEYDTDRLDPAQRDRFQVQVTVPYECDRAYFNEKFSPAIGKVAVDHWMALPDAIKNLVSPRRLDMALEMFALGGDMRDIVPQQFNVSALQKLLKIGPIDSKLANFFSKKDAVAATALFKDPNMLNLAWPIVLQNPPYVSFFLPLMPDEHLSKVYQKNNQVQDEFRKNIGNQPTYERVLQNIYDANLGDKNLRNQAKATLDAHRAKKGTPQPRSSVALGPSTRLVDKVRLVGSSKLQEVCQETHSEWVNLKRGGGLLSTNTKELGLWYAHMVSLVANRKDDRLILTASAVPVIQDLIAIKDMTPIYTALNNYMKRMKSQGHI